MIRKNKPLIKVCGMRDPQNINQLIELEPDYIGLILYPKSKRYLGDDYELEVDIPMNIKRVGVFVNAPINKVVSWKNRLQLNLVQIHGNESVSYCQELQSLGIRVIKAFGVDKEFDFSILEAYSPFCKYFLFDTKTPKHGGSGQQFIWTLLDKYLLDKPFFLSGGIGPKDVNIDTRLGNYPIHAIDINSMFEIEPAMKNIASLKQYISDFRI